LSPPSGGEDEEWAARLARNEATDKEGEKNAEGGPGVENGVYERGG